jgi:CRISPR system Cascade subunit CasD
MDNTLLLRLTGPMQSWGTSSRFQLRRTDAIPSKSGVLGLLLCAMGIGREKSAAALGPLSPMIMGVRVDRPGSLDWDYHTAGAKIGIRSADGKIKKTQSTHEYETLLSRRQYLIDASFLVVLQGDGGVVGDCARALANPVWPVFLGRKCCVPAEPVFVGTGVFGSAMDALASAPWRPRLASIDGDDRRHTRTLDIFVEHEPGSAAPEGARLVYDVPRGFGYYNHGPRWVVAGSVAVRVGRPTHPSVSDGWRDPYGPGWEEERTKQLERDNGLCVFCKSPAVEVHHVAYPDGPFRSLCKICHDACTMLEYGRNMGRRRIDPQNEDQRDILLRQIHRLLSERRLGERRRLLEAARSAGDAFFQHPEDSSEDR